MGDRTEYKRKYYEAHKEECKAYYVEHKEKINAYSKQYAINNKEKVVIYGSAYNKTPAGRARAKRYLQSPKGIVASKASHAKRRQLGFIPMNEQQEEYEGHHVDEEHIVYIPKEVHRSISHCLSTWRNMDAINVLALQYI